MNIRVNGNSFMYDSPEPILQPGFVALVQTLFSFMVVYIMRFVIGAVVCHHELSPL